MKLNRERLISHTKALDNFMKVPDYHLEKSICFINWKRGDRWCYNISSNLYVLFIKRAKLEQMIIGVRYNRVVKIYILRGF